jgi:predicted nucleic acid-binding protein
VYTRAVLQKLRDESAVVPALWSTELANGLCTNERRGRLSRAEMERGIELIDDLPVAIVDTTHDEVMKGILELARSQRLTAYDASYLHLAMTQGVPLATQDSDLRAAAVRVGVELVA